MESDSVVEVNTDDNLADAEDAGRTQAQLIKHDTENIFRKDTPF